MLYNMLLGSLKKIYSRPPKDALAFVYPNDTVSGKGLTVAECYTSTWVVTETFKKWMGAVQ